MRLLLAQEKLSVEFYHQEVSDCSFSYSIHIYIYAPENRSIDSEVFHLLLARCGKASVRLSLRLLLL